MREGGLTEDERRAIVESGPVYLANGRRAHFAGILNPISCGVVSGEPGCWACSWETAKDVAARPDRRFGMFDVLWQTGSGWLGVTPRPDDFQTPADYAAWQERQAVTR